jgi:predicted nuclease of predicted toxin-antitoxin system
MSILVDHCVPRQYLRLLQEWGYEASALREHLPPDTDDESVLELAQTLDGALLTIDMDFANIKIYPPQDYQGIIVMRYSAQNEEVVSKTLRQVLNDLYRDGLRQALIVISEERYRVRREEE